MEAIMVWCPKKRKSVPHYECFGSLIKSVNICPELIRGILDFEKHQVTIYCEAKIKKDEL